MSVRLFVGNLPYETTEAELREHFSAVGELASVYLPIDRERGKPRGFAFIEYRDRAHAEEAIRRFHNQSFKGRPLAVSEARDREDRPRPREDRPRPGGQAPAWGGTSPGPPPFEPPPPREEKRSRSFGPDAPSRRGRGKGKGGPRSERVPKGPMREISRTQVFDWGEDDDEYDEQLEGENFASRVADPYEEEND